MIGQPLRRDPPRAKSPLLGVELVWWYRFTALAEACSYAEVDNTYRRGEEGADALPLMDTYGVKCGPNITSRYGVPLERAFRKDQKALFLENIDQDLQQGQQDIGSFTVKQDTFHKFFGFSESSYEPHTRGWPRAPGPLPASL